MGMKWFHSDGHRRHDPQTEVWAGLPGPATEAPARAEAIAAALAADDAFDRAGVTEHGLGPVERVHDPALIRWLEQAWAECRALSPQREVIPDTVLHPGFGPWASEPASAPLGRLGYWCFDTMTPLVEGTYAAARGAVDVALSALDAVLAGDRAAYALCRPPGHHAGTSMIGGFCYLNNAAAAAAAMLRAAQAPVAVLDLDYHHGNGTQQIFYEVPEVRYVSLHGDPERAFPYYTGRPAESGHGAGAGANRNFPLAEGCADDEYLATLDTALDLIAAGRPAGLVVSLGFDTYRLDPICDLGLTTDGYRRIGHRVAGLGLPTVVIQEGGYHVPDLGANARSWLRGFEGLDPGEAGGSGRPDSDQGSRPTRPGRHV
jgi:acetoin utilization deacetylase AcuC-like enzyme